MSNIELIRIYKNIKSPFVRIICFPIVDQRIEQWQHFFFRLVWRPDSGYLNYDIYFSEQGNIELHLPSVDLTDQILKQFICKDS